MSFHISLLMSYVRHLPPQRRQAFLDATSGREQVHLISWKSFKLLVSYLVTFQWASSLVGRVQKAHIVQEKKVKTIEDIKEIPEALWGDPIFQVTCPVSRLPIRHVVVDPNGKTFYERDSIIPWIIINPVSPMTGKPLFYNDLKPLAGAQLAIDFRLQYYLDRYPELFT